MFFVLQSNNSFNFPLGLIKYIVIVIPLSISVVTVNKHVIDQQRSKYRQIISVFWCRFLFLATWNASVWAVGAITALPPQGMFTHIPLFFMGITQNWATAPLVVGPLPQGVSLRYWLQLHCLHKAFSLILFYGHHSEMCNRPVSSWPFATMGSSVSDIGYNHIASMRRFHSYHTFFMGTTQNCAYSGNICVVSCNECRGWQLGRCSASIKKAMVPMATFMKESRSSVIASQQGCCVGD